MRVDVKAHRLQMRARSSEQNMMACSSWQMSHCEPSACGFSATRSCFCASLFALCTLHSEHQARSAQRPSLT